MRAFRVLCASFLLFVAHAAVFEISDEIWARGTSDEVHLKVLANTKTGEHVKIMVNPGGRVEELFLRDSDTRELRDVLHGHSKNATAVWDNLHWRGVMLAPFANRIANGSYEFDGRMHFMPRNEMPARECALHGFLWDKALSIVDHTATDEYASITLSHTFGGDPGYPFAVKLTLQYYITAGSHFRVTAKATNVVGDGSEAPFFFGMHPYFNVQDVSKAHVIMDRGCAEYLHVSMPPGAPRKGSLIPTLRTTPWGEFNGSAPIGGTTDKPTYFDDEFKAASQHCRSREAAMRTLIRDDKGGAVLWQDSAFAYNQIFTGSRELWGDQAVAFEPMSAKADAFNNHDGLSVLSDGETWQGTFGIYVASKL